MRFHFRALFRWRSAPRLLAIGATIALAAWLVPRRIEGLALVDGSHRWLADDQPIRRLVAWQPPAELTEVVTPRVPPDELTLPHWSNLGTTLYFTLRRAKGDWDLYRARRVDGRREGAVPLVELNTPSDEVGVSVSADGDELYLASNRPGGVGGFDLYVSRKSKAGWGLPQNLGKAINTAADELDPTLTPDGQRLFFTSDRGSSPAKTDLFIVRRPSLDSAWGEPAALRELNLAGSNERGGQVSPDGAFLYFSSDRPARRGEGTNFDLYRARLRVGEPAAGTSEIGNPENLGPDINTSADEVGAALSDGGFAMLVASNRPSDRLSDGDAPRWALYRSRAAEVERISSWDTGRWHALAAMWWKLLVIGAVVAAAVAVVRGRRVWLPEMAAMGRFFVAGLLLQGLVVGCMLLAPVGEQIAQRARTVRLRMTAMRVSDVEYGSHEPSQEEFERVADPPNVGAVAMPEVPRQVLPPPGMPVDDGQGVQALLTRLGGAQLPANASFHVPFVDSGGGLRGDHPGPTTMAHREPMAAPTPFEAIQSEPPGKQETPIETPLARPVELAGTAPEAAGPQRTPSGHGLVLELRVEPARFEPARAPTPLGSDSPTMPGATRAPLPRFAEPLVSPGEVTVPPGKPVIVNPFPLVEIQLAHAETGPAPRRVEMLLPQVPVVRAAIFEPAAIAEAGMKVTRATLVPRRDVRAAASPAGETVEDVKRADSDQACKATSWSRKRYRSGVGRRSGFPA
ncbi:MAG TPA: hypothetical protein VGX76_10660 [Pirellulales bacterium]|nr:hypothetical protein [Pirellulales bacterium]